MATVRIPLVGMPTNRLAVTTKDQRFINCYAEMETNQLSQDPRIFLVKRPGLLANTTITGATGQARGIYSWKGSLYTVYGTGVYKGTTLVQTLATSTGRVGFAEATGATEYLVFIDGTNGYVINAAGTVTQITDVDFPTPHVPVPVYMDGYIFVIKSTTNELYNSDLENPLSWLSTNFIQAEMYPDDLVSLTRQNNQLVAFGTRTLEMFYDAGNPTGSPLARSDQLVQQQGLAARDSLDQAEGIIIWVSQSDAGDRYVVAMEGFTPNKISTEPIDRYLSADASITSASGQLVRMAGHLMYVLQITNQTLVYDMNTKIWYEFGSGTSSPWVAKWSTPHLNKLLWQSTANNVVYESDFNTYQDAGANFKVSIRTVKYDGGSMKFKQCAKVEVLGDYQSSSTNLSVSVSDDDYLTYKMTTLMDMSNRMYSWRWGQFRRRAFLLEHTDNTALRLEAIEMELEAGEV